MKKLERQKALSLFTFGDINGNGQQYGNGNRKEENHTIIIGRTGSGKTSSAKSIIIQNASEMDFYIIDFHGDYTDELFLDKTDARIWDVLEDGIPFNIFQPPVDTERGETIPIPLHIQSLRNSIKICFPSMGSRQLSLISGALELLYRNSYIQKNNIVSNASFSDLKYYLLLTADGNTNRIRVVESIIDHLRPVFDLKLLDFNNSLDASTLLPQGGTIVFRCKLPDQSDEIKKLIAVFLISGLFSQLKYTGKKDPRQKIFVQDEFHLIKDHPIWERIIREGRKFNVGLWAISQKIEDVEYLLPNVKHILIFEVFGGVQKQRIARQLRQSGDIRDEIIGEIDSLEQFEMVYMNSRSEYQKINIPPYFQNEGESNVNINEKIKKGA